MVAYTLCWFNFSSCFVYQIWPCTLCLPHLCVFTVCICALAWWWRVFSREFPPPWSPVLETLITEQEDEGRTIPSIFLCCRMDSLLGALSLKKPSVRLSAESLSAWKMASQASDARGLHCAAVLQGMHASKESNYRAKCILQRGRQMVARGDFLGTHGVWEDSCFYLVGWFLFSFYGEKKGYPTSLLTL